MALTERGVSFGSFLREFRLAAGLSQEVLAERARLSVDAIGALERGVRRVPQKQTLKLIVEALGLGPEDRGRLEAAAVRDPQPRQRDAGPQRSDGNLPRRLTRFVGRVRDVESVRRLSSSSRVVTLTGPGGVGKTRLATEAASSLVDSYPDGAWLVDLGAAGRRVPVAQEIVGVLRIEAQSEQPIREILMTNLRDRRCLLLLDECEHVVDDVATTVQLLMETCPGVDVLATSREPLRVEGERVYRLRPLELPSQGTSVDDAIAFDAIALFADRGAEADPDFVITPENVDAVADICRRLDGIPFAIELAAAKLDVMRPGEIAKRLDEPFSLLVDGRRTAPPQHRTLRALLDWSYELLSDAESIVLRRISMVSGTWDLDACAGLCRDLGSATVGIVASLVSKSLIVTDRRGDRDGFRLLETVREYALARFEDPVERAEAQRALCAYAIDLVERLHAKEATTSTAAWLEQVSGAYDVIRAALRYALEDGGDVPSGATIVSRLSFFWYARRHRDGERWFDLVLAAHDSLSPSLRADVLLGAIRARPYRRDMVELAEHAVTAYREVQDNAGLLRALESLTMAYLNTGQPSKACSAIEEALGLGDSAGPLIRATALLAFSHLYGGDPHAAAETARRSYALANEARDDWAIVLALRCLSGAALALDRPEESTELAERAITILEAIEDRRGRGWERTQLAHAMWRAGRIDDAWSMAVLALEDLADARLPLLSAEGVGIAGLIADAAGDARRAALCSGFAATLRAAVAPLAVQPLVGALLDDLRDRLSGHPEFELGAGLADERTLLNLLAEGSLVLGEKRASLHQPLT